MKKYIFFASCITGMGGAQMYLRNKSLYLQEQGWDVSLVSAQRGKIYILELKRYDWFIPELGFNYYLFSGRKRERIVNEIIGNFIQQQFEDIVIESTCMSECTWGEVVAEKIGARHLCYILQEYNVANSFTERNFLRFKYERHELAGIVQKSLQNLFTSFYPIETEKSYYLPAYCNNVVEDIDSEDLKNINRQDYDYIVGCLSRLDKPFIIHAINGFIDYAQSHLEKKYLLLMIGGAPEGSSFIKNINKLFERISNVTLHITGYLFPVPSKLLDICDVFFTSAGSAWVCKQSGIPTITYDGNDFHPIGILGRTTNNCLLRDKNEPILDLSNLLDKVLLEKSYVKEPSTQELNNPDFSSHDQFLFEMSREKNYFDFEHVTQSVSEKKLKALLFIFGAENYYKMGNWKKRLLNKSSSDR